MTNSIKQYYLVLFFLLITFATPVSALFYNEDTGEINCAKLGRLAEEVMLHRQEDYPMSTLVVFFDGEVLLYKLNLKRLNRESNQQRFDASSKSKVMSKFFKSMLIEAYEVPSYINEVSKKRESRNFRNGAELACFKDGFK